VHAIRRPFLIGSVWLSLWGIGDPRLATREGEVRYVKILLFQRNDRGFGVRYSSVGFAVVRLEGVIKGRGGGKYMHRKLMEVLKLLL
jgi:hypothetical protein